MGLGCLSYVSKQALDAPWTGELKYGVAFPYVSTRDLIRFELPTQCNASFSLRVILGFSTPASRSGSNPSHHVDPNTLAAAQPLIECINAAQDNSATVTRLLFLFSGSEAPRCPANPFAFSNITASSSFPVYHQHRHHYSNHNATISDKSAARTDRDAP